MRIDGMVALRMLRSEERSRYPKESDPRVHDGAIFPELRPSFALTPGSRVFAIGSCFARTIEEHLDGYDIPTQRFSVPKEESFPYRPRGLLNEYNPGTIRQRVERAFTGEAAPEETVVPHPDGGYVDLLLHEAVPVSRERALERRQEVDAVYRDLPRSDVVIVTLGLVEAWIDTSVDCYLNRMPPPGILRDQPGRYQLEVMEPFSAWTHLEPAFELLADTNVIVTVSPVPLHATFTGNDVTIANTFSKAVLRVCAERLSKLPNVDYFPSYEIVISAGLPAYQDDKIHVRDSVIGEIVRYMLDAYETERVSL